MIDYIIPAKNEEKYLTKCIESIRKQEHCNNIIVVDGGSSDKTISIARKEADIVIKNIYGRGKARDIGAKKAKSEYYAFIDADTVLDKDFSSKVIKFMEEKNLVATSPKHTMTGIRSKIVQFTINFLFPKRDPVLLPGFSIIVKADAYKKSCGFRDLPGEDQKFSDDISKYGKTDIIDEKLVKTSGRRIIYYGLTATLFYYLIKEIALQFEMSIWK